MRGKLQFLKNRWFLLGAGLVVGALVVLAVRFFTYSPEQVHYHANFAVYINGRREQFKGSRYYQEVAVCSTNKILTPLERTHMHDNVNDVVHVHDHAVTWGQFFENLGWYVGPDFIETADGKMYYNPATNNLHIILNGQDYSGLASITDRVIGDRDRLLVSYMQLTDDSAGELQQVLQKEYASVPSTAKHYDEAKDPASCAGSENVTLTDRLDHLF
jgi:hypothetical protein